MSVEKGGKREREREREREGRGSSIVRLCPVSNEASERERENRKSTVLHIEARGAASSEGTV